MISFMCPSCRNSLQVAEASAGQKGSCPHCGTSVDIPVARDSPTAVTEIYSTPPPSDYPVSPRIEPVQAPVPSGDLLHRPALEYAISSLILGSVGFLGSPGIVLVRNAGRFPSILLGMAVLGLGGLGLRLAIFGLIPVVNQKMPGFWYVLSALVLSGLAILSGLTLFIAAVAMG